MRFSKKSVFWWGGFLLFFLCVTQVGILEAGFLDRYVKTRVNGGCIVFLCSENVRGAISENRSTISSGDRISRQITIQPTEGNRAKFLIAITGGKVKTKCSCEAGKIVDFLSFDIIKNEYIRYTQSSSGEIKFEMGVPSLNILTELSLQREEGKPEDKSEKKESEKSLEKTAQGTESSGDKKTEGNSANLATIYTANSLWEMLLILPMKDLTQLKQFLMQISRDLDISVLRNQAKRELLEALMQEKKPFDLKNCQFLVSQLSDPDFKKRESADRKLKKMGSAVLSYLSKIDWTSLDTEQQYRLQRLRTSLEEEGGLVDASIYVEGLVDNPRCWWTIIQDDLELKKPLTEKMVVQGKMAVKQLLSLLEKGVSCKEDQSVEEQKQELEKIHERYMKALEN
ncbi:MAG: hypothetical protein Q4C96_00065 [Planctomycetia bacterium]|nr:hypothetical protein [Planctomycetia bacterium]